MVSRFATIAQTQRLVGLGLLALSGIFMIISPLMHWRNVVLKQFGAPLYSGLIARGWHFAAGKWVFGAGVAMVVVCILTAVMPRLVVVAAIPAGIASWAVSHILSGSIGVVTVWPGVARFAAFVAALVTGLLWPGTRRSRVLVSAGSVAVVVIGLVVGDIVGGPSNGHTPIVDAILPAAW